MANARLSEALESLPRLGEVTNESAQGSDVTEQLIDLDARIRNDERVERELLALIDARKGAPLNDLMSVRAQLEAVRQSIERMEAQRERAKRQVAFATINVTLQLPPEKEKPAASDAKGTSPAADALAHTKSTLGDAWRTSLRAAADGVAFLITIAIGGLTWWCVLTVMA